jgi:hypothetical protein
LLFSFNLECHFSFILRKTPPLESNFVTGV